LLQVDDVKTWVQCPKRITSLAPGVDLLNHHARGSCNTPYFDESRRSLVISTAAAVPAGAELCLTYGALQNWEFMMYYGFCPDENPYDRVTLSIDPSDMVEGRAEEISVLMRLHGIPNEHMLRPADATCEQNAFGPPTEIVSCRVGKGWPSFGILPPQLLCCLRLLFANDDISNMNPCGVPGLDWKTRACDLQCIGLMKEILDALLPKLMCQMQTSFRYGGQCTVAWWMPSGLRNEHLCLQILRH